MKIFLKLAVFLCLISKPVHANSLNDYLDFYMGADAQIRSVKFKKNFGHNLNLRKKSAPQGNLYAGIMLSKNVGLEAGYESTFEMTGHATLLNGNFCAGRHIPYILSPAVFKTKLKIKGPHVGLIFFYPLKNYPVKFLGSIGINAVKGTAEIHGVAFGRPPSPGSIRTLSKHKEALRLMVGAQYLAQNGLGFRGSMNFIKTRRIIIKKSDNHPSVQIPMLKLKDSIVYGLGAFWVF